MTGASRSKLTRFFRRARPEDRVYRIRVPFTENEFALVEREAAAHGVSIEDYLIMRALEEGEVKGNA